MKYDPKEAEPKWAEYWHKEGVYKYDPKQKGEIFSVDTPPPTVSGKMHIGHAFSYTQQDIIVRYKRLRGYKVFYPFGTDDNGLPTERLVEKEKGVKGARMERQEFTRLCLETLKDLRPKFIEDWKRIGSSCDFDTIYSTIDDNSRRISQEHFLALANKGRAYRKEAPSLWCPQCSTAISQVECEDKEAGSQFNDIIFKADNKELVIATTRPEMLSACVAVFAHPDDERYKPLFGKKAKVPLYEFEVPIMPDERADPEKGTGIVMCCTFGDQTDIEWYLAHELPLKEAIDKTGKMTSLSGKYEGMRVEEARKAILQDLKEAELLIGQKAITHEVRVHERCGTPIEIINSKQWFIKYLDLKEDLLKWGNELKWHPQFMKHRYDNWVKGLQWDWLISRQRFFGVPFPVWYCKKCDEPVFAEKLPVDPLTDMPKKKCKCGGEDFVPEKDVLDTWATSSLTPQIATSLVPEEQRKELFPMSLRPQAHDIITFWLFNTLVRSQMHYGKNPWKEVVISGFVTLGGEKMSKSKGNIIEPQKVIEKYSADGIRYWAGSSKFGEDMDYQEKDVKTGEKFVMKLWNASRFAGMHLQDYTPGKVTQQTDRWVLAKLAKAIKAATDSFDKYDYAHAKAAIEKFFWQEFCDNYLELVKGRLYEPKKPDEKTSAQTTIYTCLYSLLRLFAPFTPFITEEIYQSMFKQEGHKSIHIAGWPEPPERDEQAELAGDVAVEVLAAVRKKKSEAKQSMKAPVKRLVIQADADLKGILEDLKATANAETIELGEAEEQLSEKTKATIELE